MLNRTICTIIFFVVCSLGAAAQSTTFTYQGNLQNGGSNANGTYDFQFALFDAASGGSQIGTTLTVSSVTVTNGNFKVDLDFGPQFPGANRFLQISVRLTGGAGYTLLSLRQPVSSVPYSITSLRSGDSDRLGGIEASQYLTTTSGASVFIQNGSTPQAGGFNLNGTGTASILNATTQFNLGGSRILSAGGGGNTFAGFGAGVANSIGGANSFFGNGAGSANTEGFFNSFFGQLAGESNTTGSFNSFFGRSAGLLSSVGGSNSFFGSYSGSENLSGAGNSFFGHYAGFTNSTGSFNTILGSQANVGLGNLTNATAVGYRALVNQSNSLVLGSINGVNGASADTNVGIGTMSPTQRLQVVGNGVFSGNLGIGTTSPSQKLHIFDNAANIVFGGLGCGTGFVGINFFGDAQSNNCINYSMLGDGTSTYFNRSNSGWMFFRMANNDQMVLSPSGNLGIGLVNPSQRLQVEGNGAFSGWLSSNLDTAGATAVCRNSLGRLSSCSSSIRYKENVQDYSPGLDLVRRLRPVTFNWKANNEADFGLVAEETAGVEPLLVTRNDEGEVEGVKYDRVGVVLINAVSEQQTQIEALEKKVADQSDILRRQEELIKEQDERIMRQRNELEALKQLVCAQNPSAVPCRPTKEKP